MPKFKNSGSKPDPKIVRKIVAENIRKYRRNAKLSQMDLAGHAWLDLATVNRIERAQTDTTISSLARLRLVLKIAWDELLEGI
jgi:ribosome-binding protein aMBF1 (putative translation factor)